MRASPSLGLYQYGLRAALAGALLLTAAGTATAGDRAGAVLGGAALGLLGGVALGSALAAPPPPPYYRPRPVYVEAPRPVYVDAPREVYVRPAPGPICHFERRKAWLNDVEFTYRRVEVCE